MVGQLREKGSCPYLRSSRNRRVHHLQFCIMSRRRQKKITPDRLEEFVARISGDRLPLRVAELLTERRLVGADPQRTVELLQPLADRLRAGLTEESDRYEKLLGEKELWPPLAPRERELIRALARLLREIVRARLKWGVEVATIEEIGREASALSTRTGSAEEQIDVLLLQGEILTVLGSLEEAAHIRDRAVAISRDSLPDFLPHALAARADVRVRLGESEEALKDCTEAEKVLSEIDPAEEQPGGAAEIEVLLARTIALRPTDPRGAFQTAEKATRIAEERGERDYLPGAITYLLYPMLTLGDPTGALELALRGLEVARREGTVAIEAEIQRVIAMIRAQSGDHEGAAAANREAVTVARRTGSRSLLLHALTGEGDSYREYQQYEEAALRYREAFDLLPSDSPSEYRSYLLLRLGEMSLQEGEVDRAESYYREGLKESEELGLRQGIEDFSYLLGRLLQRAGRLEEAETWFERVADGLDEENPRSFGVNALARLADLHAANGAFESAYRAMKRYTPLKLELELLFRKNELQTTLLRHEREQVEQQAKIERLERERAEEEALRRRAEVERAAFDLTEKGELIHVVESTIRNLLEREKTSEEVKIELRSILGTIEAHTATNGVAMTYLRSVDPAFYATLRARHPELTPGQVRLCGFLRAGLTSADIAGILYITRGAVTKQRSRLRRTLGLDRKENLERHLRDIEP